MREFAVTALQYVAVPPTKVTDPNELAPAVVVVATLVLSILFPAVPKTRFPLVAVMAPEVRRQRSGSCDRTCPAHSTRKTLFLPIPIEQW